LFIKLSKSFQDGSRKKKYFPLKVFFVCLLVDLILWCQFSGLQSNKKASLRKHSFFHYLLQIEINRLSVHYFIKRNKKKGTENDFENISFSCNYECNNKSENCGQAVEYSAHDWKVVGSIPVLDAKWKKCQCHTRSTSLMLQMICKTNRVLGSEKNY